MIQDLTAANQDASAEYASHPDVDAVLAPVKWETPEWRWSQHHSNPGARRGPMDIHAGYVDGGVQRFVGVGRFDPREPDSPKGMDRLPIYFDGGLSQQIIVPSQ